MRKYFGTDGIRGRANQEPMTSETIMRVAMAAAGLFKRGDHRHRVVIGKDTRLSGYMLEPALTAGFIAKGMDVILLGPLPTPAVAMLTPSLRADMGVMISASHNPYEDNGIKLFGPDGSKLSDELELKIEQRMESNLADDHALSSDLGRASRLEDAIGRYVEYAKATYRGGDLEGLKIVVDCANGAAYKVAPTVLWELGAQVIPIAVNPNGRNINDHCGATHPQTMQEAVLMHQADFGIALDGDADRLIMSDENGRRIDGDQLMALVALSWAKAGRLHGGALIATVMSNLGMERYLASQGIGLIRTPVGDRYVVEAMKEHGCNIGGEQSGHIVLSDYCTTGDGLIAALQVVSVIRESGRKASEVCSVFKPVPQILQNVRAPGDVLDKQSVREVIAQAETKLGKQGRFVIRKSGTEPLVRVMAEGDDGALVQQLVNDICEAVKKRSSYTKVTDGSFDNSAELNQPLPRQVMPNRRMLLLSLGLPLFMLVWVFGMMGYITVWPAMKQATLKKRGVDAVATFDKITPQRTKSGSVFYIVNFHYTQVGQLQPVYQGDDKIFPAPMDSLQTGATYPALYDPQDPANVRINLHNAIRTNDPYRILGVILLPVGGFILFMVFLIPAVFLYQYSHEKKLLVNGSVAVPTLTGESEYSAGKAGKLAKVTYRFTDAQGQNVEGERKGLPTVDKGTKYALWQKQRDLILKNPIVVYDPNDSSKNKLYPMIYAVCIAPAREWGK